MSLNLLFQSRQANHDELVEIRVEDGEKLHALQQRIMAILRLFKDTPVELDPAQFAIDIKIGSIQVQRGGYRCWVLLHTINSPIFWRNESDAACKH